MNKTIAKTLGLIGLCLLLLYFLREFQRGKESDPGKIENPIPGPDQPDPGPSPAPGPPSDLSITGFKGKEFIYTRHARCRMGCREIEASEVADILLNGKINMRKSDPKDRPCPTYAYEAVSRDGQRIRAVIADCNREVKLITVIDLDNKYHCDCK